jgi:hypothetical protein
MRVIRGTRRLAASVAASLLLARGGVTAGHGAPQARNGPAAAQFADVARLVVMIEADLAAGQARGTGIVFAVKDNTAYVLTANHVVRSIDQAPPRPAAGVRVYFHVRPEEPVPAKVLPLFRLDADLAVLEVDAAAVDLQSAGPLPFDLLLGDPPRLRRGDPVFPIGNSEGVKWISPIQPDSFDGTDSDSLYFQSANVEPGYSGGPVCSADWRPIGIVLAVAERPVVRALPMAIALRQLRDWGFGIGVAKSEAAPSRASPAPERTPTQAEGGVREERSAAGTSYRRFTAWGGWPESDSSWVQLAATRVQGLPPLTTMFGNVPDFLVIVSPRSGAPKRMVLKGADRCVFPPIRVPDLDDALVRIGRQSTFSSGDVTVSAPVSSARLAQGQQLRLRYSDDVLAQVRDRTDATEVALFMRAAPFWPEARSGPDREPQGASTIRPDVVAEDSVSFDDGDATDHFLVNPSGGSCSGLLWLEGAGVALTSSARRSDEGSLIPILDAPGGAEFELYELVCEGRRTMVRIQADGPGGHAKYAVAVRSQPSPGDPKLLSWFVAAWVRGWTESLTDSFEFKEDAPSQWDHIDRGITAIRRLTSQSPEAFVTALDAAFKSGIDEHFDGIRQGYWDLLESVVTHHLDEVGASAQKCCAAAVGVRLMVNLLLAEKNLTYDRSALTWGKNLRELPPALSKRVQHFLPQPGK